jgi:hypothetical protein
MYIIRLYSPYICIYGVYTVYIRIQLLRIINGLRNPIEVRDHHWKWCEVWGVNPSQEWWGVRCEVWIHHRKWCEVWDHQCKWCEVCSHHRSGVRCVTITGVVWGVRCEVWSVSPSPEWCEVWGVRCEVCSQHRKWCEVCHHHQSGVRCEVWGVRCEVW